MTRAWLGILGVAGCSGAIGPGEPADRLDVDGDGWTLTDGDCDDADPAVNPVATDVPGDGADQDCDGADDAARDLRTVTPGELLVSEIMPAPLGVEGRLGEWFEITNTSGAPIDLVGLLVLDAATDDFVVTSSLVVPAGGAVVMGGWADPALNGGVPVDHTWKPGFGLTNDGDTVALHGPTSIIDSVTYDPTWPAEDGLSLSRDPTDPALWCVADEADVYGPGGSGTPGAENPPCGVAPPTDAIQVGDLVITEIQKDPEAAADLDAAEWIEVFNTTNATIDLRGLVVTGEAEEAFEVPDSLPIPPGGYVVLGGSADRALNGDVAMDAAWGADFALSNGDDRVALMWAGGVIDAVDYDNGVTFPDEGGAALSLDRDSADAVQNDAGGAWCPADSAYGDGDLGTPGAANPPC